MELGFNEMDFHQVLILLCTSNLHCSVSYHLKRNSHSMSASVSCVLSILVPGTVNFLLPLCTGCLLKSVPSYPGPSVSCQRIPHSTPSPSPCFSHFPVPPEQNIFPVPPHFSAGTSSSSCSSSTSPLSQASFHTSSRLGGPGLFGFLLWYEIRRLGQVWKPRAA